MLWTNFYDTVFGGVMSATTVNLAAAMGLVKAFRTHGHLASRLDPLGALPPGDPSLDPATLGLTPEIMATIRLPGSTMCIRCDRYRVSAMPVARHAAVNSVVNLDDHPARRDLLHLRRPVHLVAHRVPQPIRRYRDLPEDVLVLPSHGLPFRGAHARIAQLEAHHAERLAELQAACVASPRAAADVLGVAVGV